VFNIFKNISGKEQQGSIGSILVIEDSTADMMFIQRVLEKKGYSIFKAADGEIGLSIIYNNQIDLIILDYILPGMNGPKVCQILKQDSRTKSIPIIFLTVVEGGDILECYGAGAERYLHKPVTAKELLRQVETLLFESKGKEKGAVDF